MNGVMQAAGIVYEPPALAARKPVVVVTQPASGSKVTSPLEVNGKAKGPWFFEGQLPVKLLDGNGKVLAIGAGIAQTDWMVQDYVVFKASLTFIKPTTAKGTLVIQKENPSGDPARDAEFKVQVSFK